MKKNKPSQQNSLDAFLSGKSYSTKKKSSNNISKPEKKEEIFKKLQEKLKIKNADYEKDIKGNLTLWQKKEEAEKLFPGTQDKNENEEDE